MKKRYKFRYDHTFEQADICYNQNRQIIGIGKKLSLNKTKAEFIGMIKLSKEGCKIFKNNLNFIPKKKIYKMQIHEYLNFLIKKKIKIYPCFVKGKLMEIDTYNDLKIAKKMFQKV